jgi:hypothetical protein
VLEKKEGTASAALRRTQAQRVSVHEQVSNSWKERGGTVRATACVTCLPFRCSYRSPRWLLAAINVRTHASPSVYRLSQRCRRAEWPNGPRARLGVHNRDGRPAARRETAASLAGRGNEECRRRRNRRIDTTPCIMLSCAMCCALTVSEGERAREKGLQEKQAKRTGRQACRRTRTERRELHSKSVYLSTESICSA